MRYLLIILLLNFLNSELIKPENLDTLHSIYGLFEWKQRPYALNYNLQVSKTSTFDDIVIDTNSYHLIYIDKDYLEWDSEYYWRVRPIFEDSNTADWIDTFSFHTGFLKNDPNAALAEIINEDLIQDGFTIYGNSMNDCSIMYDKFGQEIWNDGILGTKILHIDEFGQMYSSGLYSGSTHKNIPLKFNFHHDILWQGLDPEEPPYGMNAHDLKELPNGNFLYARDYYFSGPIPLGPWTPLYQSLGYEADGETNEYSWQSTRLYEIDQNNHSILKEWDATDYFSMNVYDSIGATWNWSINLDYFDWIHNNSIWYDELEDAVYLSSRQLSRITKIDYSSGDIIWMMGLPNEYVPSNFNDHICTDLLFSFQHDAKILDNGHLLLFDNGNLSQIVRGTEYKTTRILEVDVLDNHTCNIIWEYDLPEELHGASRGNVMKLDNGNYLINIATGSGKIIEVTSEKEIVWILDLNPSEDYSVGNYRAFRVSSVYPDAYYVLFNSLEEINLGETSYPGVILSEENTVTIEIFNESGYTQDYQYIFSNNTLFFDSVNEIITIEANESITLTFQGKNIDTNDFTEIDFTVTPINHQYAEKQFHFYVSKSNNISLIDFKILKIYPNPFNASSKIIFDVPYQSEVQVEIYNIKGQLLDVLLNETKDEGRYIVEWNAQNYSSGVYFITMTSEDFIETQKVTLIK